MDGVDGTPYLVMLRALYVPEESVNYISVTQAKAEDVDTQIEGRATVKVPRVDGEPTRPLSADLQTKKGNMVLETRAHIATIDEQTRLLLRSLKSAVFESGRGPWMREGQHGAPAKSRLPGCRLK